MASQTVLKGLKRVWKSIPLSTLNQGASLSIRSEVPVTSVSVISQWRDDGHIEMDHIFTGNDIHRHGKLGLAISKLDDEMTSLGRSASHVAVRVLRNLPMEVNDDTFPGEEETSLVENCQPGVHLSVVVPEKVNIDILLEHGGDIHVPGKIEGDVALSTHDGAITVKKLRGHKLRLESFGEKALVYATDLLEAQQLSITTSGRFRAKQVHASSIDARVSHNTDYARPGFEALEQDDDAALIDISSIYVSGQGGATLSVQSAEPTGKAVRVKTSHGPIRVQVDGVSQPKGKDTRTNEIQPLVELGGVNGNFELLTENTSVNELWDWKSCLVHVDSLSPDTVSLLSTDAGNISLTIDRKVEADIRLLSTTTKDCLTEAGALLADEEDSELALDVVRNIPSSPSGSMSYAGEPRIEIATKAFTERANGSYQSSHIHYIDGWVENNSAEPPSRFDRNVRGESGSIGKINIESAAEQALSGFGEKIEGGTKTEAEYFPRPLLAVIGTSKITVETVSWLGAIARRYGLDEEGRELGRTASRRGRPIVPPTE